jgi:hypothetical protein
MKKYSVTLFEHVRHTYEVKANNEEQAVQLATERSDFDDGDVDGQYNGYEIELIEDGVDEEQLRKEFEAWLYSLLYNRFSYDKLTELIREKTGIADLKVHMDIGDECTDYHAAFDIEGEHEDHPLAGEFNIYYLKMREDACEAFGYEERIYITEVNASYYN